MARHFAEDERLLRMDGFLAKLAERRRRAATNLEETGRSGDPAAFRRVAELAERLRTRICDRVAITSDDPDLIASRLENGRSLIMLTPCASPPALAALVAEGFETADTPWGTGVVLDDARRRGMAARLAATLRDLDSEVSSLLS